MKIIKKEILVNKCSPEEEALILPVLNTIDTAIKCVANPPSDYTFKIRPIKKANGVKPIKDLFVSHLHSEGWKLEAKIALGSRIRPGPIDAIYKISENVFFAVEWETGNISSSHRAINKLCLGIMDNKLLGGILVLPSRKLYQYLTDRVGNFSEIEPYFPIWRNVKLDRGYLSVIEIEYDSLDDTIPCIPKGTDGRHNR